MSNEVTIQDLPDEMLENILLQLELDDRKSALRVCKRWSALKPFDLSSVQLVIDADEFNDHDCQDYLRALLASSERYKHLVVYISGHFEKHDLLLEILSSVSESVESLKLNFKPIAADDFPYREPTSVPTSTLVVFAKIAALSSKLKHLQISECLFESDGSDLEFPSMNNLEKLYLKNNLLELIPNMEDITPNISRLHTCLRSKESLNFLRHVSSQLVELEIWFRPEDDFLEVCAMQFPLLEKLSIFLPKEEFDYVRSNFKVERFLQKLHRLKGLTLGNLLTDHVGNLCQLQSFEYIQFLCLYHPFGLCMNLGPYDLRAICKLKHLKRLRIAKTIVRIPNVLDFPPLQSLQMLSLDSVLIDDHSMFKRFRQYSFPRLAIFEILNLRWPGDEDEDGDLFEQHDILCSDMPCMKRLGLIEERNDLHLGKMLELCASRAPQELRIKCRRVLDTDPLHELRPITVKTLAMEVSHISLESLKKLIKSMGELKRLELAFRPKGLAPFNPYYTLPQDSIQSLRNAFPRCEIVERLRIQIREPLW